MYAESYRSAKGRVVELMAGKDSDVIVPACPDWTASDVVRHLCGLSVDLTNGVFDGFASDEWTDQQVKARSDRHLSEVLAEWEEAIEPASALLDDLDSLDIGDTVESAAGSFPRAARAPMAIGDILH